MNNKKQKTKQQKNFVWNDQNTQIRHKTSAAGDVNPTSWNGTVIYTNAVYSIISKVGACFRHKQSERKSASVNLVGKAAISSFYKPRRQGGCVKRNLASINPRGQGLL